MGIELGFTDTGKAEGWRDFHVEWSMCNGTEMRMCAYKHFILLNAESEVKQKNETGPHTGESFVQVCPTYNE